MSSSEKARDAVRLLAKTPQIVASDVELDSASTSLLVEELAKLSARKRRMTRLKRNLAVVPLVIPFVMLLSIWQTPNEDASLLPVLIGISIALALVFGVFFGIFARASKYDHALVRLVKEYGDVSAIGPLVDSSKVEGIDQKIVTSALIQLLHRLKASDSHLLNGRQRQDLFSELTLEPESDPNLRIALLYAILQIGDPTAIPYVFPLAEGASGRAGELAAECLAALQDVEARELNGGTLLRAAGMEGIENTESLLRPAVSMDTSSPELLLRAEVERDHSNET